MKWRKLLHAPWLTGDYSPAPTQSVLQMEAVECGAACLAMILAYHGRYESLENLRLVCGVSRDGSKASNIVKAARQMGLCAKGLRAEPHELKQNLGPQIVFWNFNHFVVLEGFAKGRAWLNDPASGRRSISEAEFDAAFTGVVLVFEPDSGFVKSATSPRLLPPILARLRGSWLAFRQLFFISLLLTIPGLLVPVFSRLFIDYYLVQKFEDWLEPLIIGIICAALLRAWLTWLQQMALLKLNTSLSLAWSTRFVWHVLRLPLNFFQQRFAGEIAARVIMNDKLANLVGGELAMAVAHLISVAVFLCVMLQYNLWVSLAAIFIALCNLAALWWNQQRTLHASQSLQMDQGKFVAALLQGTQQIETLKVAGAEHVLFQRWLGLHAKVMNAEQNLGRLRLLTNALPHISTGLLLAVVLQVGGWQVMAGSLSLGMLVALLALAANLSPALIALVSVGSKLQEAQAFVQRLDDVLQHPRALEFANEASEQAALHPSPIGRVEMRDVSFGYSPLDAPLLQHFNLTIEPGQRVAVVGATGSGKSSLGKLLAGLLLPWSGEILLDGKPLSSWPRLELRTALAMVDQDICLFEASIRDNLTLWNPHISDGWCVRAAKDAAVHDVIARRAAGYAHQVQEGGRNFSAGERQRLEIARALVAQPRFLILDEATSALDPALELEIMQALRRRGMSCLLIAHRLSTVRDCDCILVLQQGRLVESGSHAQLMEKRGHYWRLVEN